MTTTTASRRPITPLSPTPSTLSSLSSAAPSPDFTSSSSSNPWKYDSPFSSKSVKMEMGLDGRLAFATTSPSPSPTPRSTTTTTKAPQPKRKERQTRIQEHLKIVKPGSPSPSASSNKSSTSSFYKKLPVVTPTPTKATPSTSKKSPKSTTTTTTAKKSKKATAAAKVIIEPEQEGTDDEEAEEREAELVRMELTPVKERTAMEDEVMGMREDEVQRRLERQKVELMQTLASHGINPHPDVLDHALRSMATSDSEGSGLSVENFLLALSSIAPSTPTPLTSPTHAEFRTPGPKTRKHRKAVSFSTLEAPSTPSEPSTSPTSATTHFSPLPRLTRSAAAQLLPPQLPTPTTPLNTLAPSPDILATPSERKEGRIRAFGSRQAGSHMVAAELKGIGRVAMSRHLLFEKLGQETAELAIAAAAPQATAERVVPAFGEPVKAVESPLIDSFTSIAPIKRRKGREMQREEEGERSQEHDDKLGQIRMWLDSPELTDDDEARGDTWSTIPPEWDAELDGLAMEDIVAKPLEPISYIESEEDEEEVVPTSAIRVGGKNIRILVQTKRKRALEDESRANGAEDPASVDEDDEENGGEKHANYKGKGRAVDPASAEETHCICERGDEGEAMVQCDHCRIWYHLDCLNISSARKLPKEWFCFRCHGLPTPDTNGPPPLKRARFAPRSSTPPATPTPTPTYHPEPTLVPSSFSPRPRGNFYRGSGHDTVLAPSPRQTRKAAPRSPIIAQPVPEPITPQLGHSRHDYAPRSPLSYRNGRSRMLSGVFEDITAPGQSNWNDWNGHVYNHSTYEQHTMVTPLEEEEDGLHPRSWYDMTMTPSRSLSSANANPWGELQTPVTNSRRRKPSHNGYTSAQDFLSGLHQNQGSESHQQQQHGSAFAQRLFNSPTQSYSVPPSHAPYYATPSSPLSKRHHRRHSSLSNNFLASPSSRSAAPPTQHQQQGQVSFSSPFASPSVRPKGLQHSHSMPPPQTREMEPSVKNGGGANYHNSSYQHYSHPQGSQQFHERASTPSSASRNESGLGIGFDGGVELDDLLPFDALAQS